jgi:hypothetical protein
MLARSNRNQTSTTPEEKAKRADSARDGKARAPEHNAVWQSLALRPASIQPKLSVSQPGDMDEQEADRVADQVMRMPAPSNAHALPISTVSSGHAQRKCSGCEEEDEKLQRKADGASLGGAVAPDSSTVHETLGSQGQPLDASARAFFEPRFGRDFSRVRIHADTQAERSAQAARARAYTLGQHIVFGASEYAPASTEGGRLLAHELTHVAQQSSLGSSKAIQRKKDKKPAPLFYQKALDLLAIARKGIITIQKATVIPDDIPVLEAFVELAEAVDREDKEAIPDLLEAFTSDTKHLPPNFPSPSLVTTMVTRLLMIGLGDEAEDFRKWYHKHKAEQELMPERKRDFGSELTIWEGVLEGILGQLPTEGADAALKVMDVLLVYADQARSEALGMDQEAIKDDREYRRAVESGSGPNVHFGATTLASLYDSLLGLIKRAFTGMQVGYQVVLEQAIKDLETGKGPQTLDAAKGWLDKLKGFITPLDEKKKVDEKRQIGGMKVEVTRSEYAEGGGTHLDFFAKGKEAKERTVKFQFYDYEMRDMMGSEKELDFARILTIRRDQINVIEHIYGQERDAQGNLTAETEENAAAIAKLGKTGLRLENDDDWRRFLVEKFEARKATSSTEEALNSVINLLKVFLHTFTTHSPYNIDDFGDNMLTRKFPRAMTGQLIQDCGIYALRIAYMLSLLRDHKDLQLRFRFIVLPAHVGLIITGKDLPLYIAHNDQIVVFSPKDLADIRKQWNVTDDVGGTRAPSGTDEEDKFVAEMAAQEFVATIDLPYQLLDVPELEGGPDDIKEVLWSFYKRETEPADLFSDETRDPKSPYFQFHLKYLKALDLMKEHHNKSLIHFWNEVGHKVWKKHEPKLLAAKQKIKAAKSEAARHEEKRAFAALVNDYDQEVRPFFEKVEADYDPVEAVRGEIITVLAEHPSVIKSDKITASGRLAMIFKSPWWRRDFNNHIDDLKNKKVVEAPYAKEKDLLWPID